MSLFKRPRQQQKAFPLLPSFCERCVPEGRGAFLELVVVNHEKSSSLRMLSRDKWGRQEWQAPGAFRELAGVLWDHIQGCTEKAAMGRKADSWNIWWLHLERRKKQGWSCCLVPKSHAREGPCDSRGIIGSPVSWHLVIWKKYFIRSQKIGV